ncbi:uncharacterized protein LOC141900067 [Tubulanus polymorphus]|uniref:uncharacterized protein LOC141900067 n=1 Tax=Tubulanus polymorphus TaxID=672921 RepID=UPI003DA364AE
MLKFVVFSALIVSITCRVVPAVPRPIGGHNNELTGTPKGICHGPEDSGKHFKHDCNYCTCSNAPGLAACTRIGCPPIYGTPKEVCNGEKDIGLVFKNDCNSCFCSAHPGVAGCTLMACPQFERQNEIVEIPAKM